MVFLQFLNFMWVYFGSDEQLIQSKTETLSQGFSHEKQKIAGIAKGIKQSEVDVNSIVCFCIFV
jgi:hypothetical protein